MVPLICWVLPNISYVKCHLVKGEVLRIYTMLVMLLGRWEEDTGRAKCNVDSAIVLILAIQVFEILNLLQQESK